MPWTPLVSIVDMPPSPEAWVPCSMRVPAPIHACPCCTGLSGPGGAAATGPALVTSRAATPLRTPARRAALDLTSRRVGELYAGIAASGHVEGTVVPGIR
ncbi:hypothetical protein GCM10010518_44950 [Kitasatospora cinereorecta]